MNKKWESFSEESDFLVDVLDRTLSVVFVEDLKEGDEDLDGWVDLVDETICIRAGLPPHIREEVLLHELLHALDQLLLGGVLDEVAINCLQRGLTLFYRQFKQSDVD